MEQLQQSNFKYLARTWTSKAFRRWTLLPPGVKSRYGIQHLPVRLDLHTRKAKDPAGDFALLIDQFTALSKTKGRTGIVIHHQRMTPFAFEFLDRMIYNLKYVIKARFCSFKEMLNSPNEKQAVARLR